MLVFFFFSSYANSKEVKKLSGVIFLFVVAKQLYPPVSEKMVAVHGRTFSMDLFRLTPPTKF